MPSRDSDARRRAILDSALDLVAAEGFDALTITALTIRSGASNGSIYHHFGNRGGIVRALYGDSLHRCVDALIPALDDRPAEKVVPDLARRYLDWIADNQPRARFIYAAALTTDGRHDDVQQFKATVFAPLNAWYTRRAAAGEVRSIPLWTLDAVVMGPAHECARRFLAAPSHFDLDTARRAVAHAAWAIVRTAPTGG